MNFKPFSTVDFDKIFAMSLLYVKAKYGTQNKLLLVLFLIARILSPKLKYDLKEMSGKGNYLFVYLNDSWRKDILDAFMNVVGWAEKADVIMSSPQKKSYCFKPNKNIKVVKYIPGWIKILSKENYNCIEILRLLMDLIELYHFNNFIGAVNLCNYKLVTVFYDAMPLYNFLVQVCKHKGIKTATLQHGVIISTREGVSNNIDFSGIELKNSVCDYFLAWNNFTKREAVKSGLEEQNIKVLGSIKSSEKIIFPELKSNRFGVILDGEFTKGINIGLIELSKQIATKYGKKFVVRYHPNFSGKEYDAILNNEISEVCSFDLSLTDFLSQMEFSIVANSTVLVEIANSSHLVFRYTDGSIFDKFRDLNYPTIKRISDFEFQLERSESLTSQLFDELVSVNNIGDNYKRFYKSIQ